MYIAAFGTHVCQGSHCYVFSSLSGELYCGVARASRLGSAVEMFSEGKPRSLLGGHKREGLSASGHLRPCYLSPPEMPGFCSCTPTFSTSK